MSNICLIYKQKLTELKQLHQILVAEKARAERDGLVTNKDSDVNILEHSKELENKTQELKQEFKDYLHISPERAQEIMGKELFLGPGEFKKTFGFTPETPEIPFSREELERARELGQQLILYAGKTSDGKLFTVDRMHDATGEALASGEQYNFSYHHLDDPVLSVQTPRSGWRLTTSEVLDRSRDRSYLRQTDVLIKYLEHDVFLDQELPAVYVEAIIEFEQKREEIKKIPVYDKRSVASLVELSINQLMRERSSEVFQRLLLQESNNNIRNLSRDGVYTASINSDGELMSVGLFYDDTIDFTNWPTIEPVQNVGACFSRSA